MEQPLWLTVLQVLSALATPAVAIFTWKLAQYTQKLVEAQEASNRVLERQLLLQEKLEATPFIALSLESQKTNSGGNRQELVLTNLGRIGVFILKVKKHAEEPPDAGRQGEEIPGGAYPKPLISSESLRFKNSDASKTPYVEVIYQDGATGKVWSDLWRVDLNLKEQQVAPVWRAREVPEARDQES